MTSGVKTRALVHSEFDSEIFNLPFYHVRNPEAPCLLGEIAALKAKGAFMADAKIQVGKVDLIRRLTAAGFRRAATMITLTAPPANPGAAHDLSRKLHLSDAEIAAHAAGFTHARFVQDCFAPEGAGVALMTAWIRNSLNGRRRVLADGRNFCSYAVEDGAVTIDLLSSIDRGRGSAARLLAGVQAISAAEANGRVFVTTEAENIRALRIYVRAGFMPVAAHLAMHLRHDAGER